MAPTIQTQAQREDGHRPNSHRTLPERSGVVCRVKYCNSLPDIPFDPKFITYPFDQNRFVQYKATSLEKQHKHDLLTEPDLGVTIDLINPDTYRIDPNVLLDPADEKLLEEEIQAPTSSKRSQQHAKVVPWMRKTEYISTEFNRYGISNEKPEVKIGVSVKQQFTEEEIYKDRDSQITAIEKTFEDAQKSVTEGLGWEGRQTKVWLQNTLYFFSPCFCLCQISQHYSKPRVTPVEVMPVFPDFKMWINPCAQVIFDSDPAPKDTSGAAALEMMSQAMIRGMMDEEGNQFVAYFLPVEETLKKRKRDQEEEMDYAPDDVYDYKIAREYNWNVKNKASKGYEENYFFIFREGDGVYYNELETRVRLSKRRAKAGVQSGTNALLVVKHRDMNEKELEAQEARKAQLENHEPEEEEEEEMEMEEKEAGGSDEEREKGSSSEKEGSEDEHSGSESEREEGDRDEASDKSGSGEDESSEDEARAARDKEEIFGSDADSEDDADSDDEDRGRARGSDNDSDSGSDGGGQRSRSASPFPSGSEHSAQEDGSEAAASDSSEAESDSD
ncbi:RNA polymerase II-associated factor 1 homolog isoform X1 [Hippopotamus amphibius kiboko]|uniref:RNA polymerase II-associated factor 1 homolog isoform X1 n=1 Tax=Hippopotamus amphibius kiboko TaxID=575201 RepID=UPI00259364D5|nr:RNA polymerase II-associated factor 1 homolog isoform X1 [Hippopotamus amphibius kiboko]